MKEICTKDITAFKDFIENHKEIIVVGHKEPDGDCISSCIGISYILKHFNKSYKLINAGPFKRVELAKYADLFSSEVGFMSQKDIEETGLIMCDCSEFHRIGDFDTDLKELDTFFIDHHKSVESLNLPNSIIDSSSPAAALLVQLLYENTVGPVTKEVADVLFFGSMTDTGFFRFLSPNDSNVLVAISRLVAAGADPRNTYDYITSGKAYSTRKLLGVLLNHAEQYADGKLILTYETMEDTKKYGQEGRDSDLLYSSLLAVKGVEAVVFLRQETESTCTAGFRSKNDVDVSLIAQKFGGGGHKNASGLSTNGKLDTLIPQIVKEFCKVL